MKDTAILLGELPTAWLENYVTVFEAGRVQDHPRARFVTARGECCVVGALAAAESAEAVVGSKLWSHFLGGELEQLSRGFEAGRVTGREVYEAAVYELAARRSVHVVEPRTAGVGA